MMILKNRQFSAIRRRCATSSGTRGRAGWLLPWLLTLLAAGHLHAQQGTAVSARFASVKGVVMVSTSGGGERQVQKGDSIRSGTVIQCGLEAGALLRPMPKLSVVIYPESKVRYEGADVMQGGSGHLECSILAGKALFHIDPPAPDADPAKAPRIEVTVNTEEGVIVNRTGGQQKTEAGQPAGQTRTATWTVQHDEGRTVVAVGEGSSDVSIGKGSAAGNGDFGGQIEVPEGSVIWLFNRGGKVAAELVDTLTGKVTNLTGGLSQGGDLVEQSKKQLVTPSSSGTTTTLSQPTTNPGGGTGTTPTTPTNPDFSNPLPTLPVVSADTP